LHIVFIGIFVGDVRVAESKLTDPDSSGQMGTSMVYVTLQFLNLIGSRPSDHYFRSVCLSVCLCRVFLSRLWSDFDQTRTYVICLGL